MYQMQSMEGLKTSIKSSNKLNILNLTHSNLLNARYWDQR